mmetsp:Transcript_13630/g.40631  ORF Transcript_13630/g.40631 Transcript_13630/m.40631 type:complete len:297 (+) Transcript_13630:193-1083(+)
MCHFQAGRTTAARQSESLIVACSSSASTLPLCAMAWMAWWNVFSQARPTRRATAEMIERSTLALTWKLATTCCRMITVPAASMVSNIAMTIMASMMLSSSLARLATIQRFRPNMLHQALVRPKTCCVTPMTRSMILPMCFMLPLRMVMPMVATRKRRPAKIIFEAPVVSVGASWSDTNLPTAAKRTHCAKRKPMTRATTSSSNSWHFSNQCFSSASILPSPARATMRRMLIQIWARTVTTAAKRMAQMRAVEGVLLYSCSCSRPKAWMAQKPVMWAPNIEIVAVAVMLSFQKKSRT